MMNNQFLDKVEPTFRSLYERWQDEKEYEDFAEYREVMKKLITEHGAEFLDMTKRPFAFKYTLNGEKFELRMTATRSSLFSFKKKLVS